MASIREDTTLVVQGVSHHFGAKRILFDVNLQVYEGQILALVGPSGCGKSTLLNCVVGTLKPSQGKVLMRAQNGFYEIQGPARDRGIVYQKYSLFPFLTAVQNVAWGLMVDKISLSYRLLCYPLWKRLQKQHLNQAEALLQKLGLGKAVNLFPREMSGGMCQRVAVAQALIMKPRILLLDEPFGALDESTREELQLMMRSLSKENQDLIKRGETPYTIIIVTHQMEEALFVGDRLVGLSQYWDWESENFSECPGATIVYDQQSPVYGLSDIGDVKGLEQFKKQMGEVKKTVFDANFCQKRHEFIQPSEQ